MLLLQNSRQTFIRSPHRLEPNQIPDVRSPSVSILRCASQVACRWLRAQCVTCFCLRPVIRPIRPGLFDDTVFVSSRPPTRRATGAPSALRRCMILLSLDISSIIFTSVTSGFSPSMFLRREHQHISDSHTHPTSSCIASRQI